VLAATEHKAISLSLFFLSGIITCSYYIGYQLGNWLLQQQYDRWKEHQLIHTSMRAKKAHSRGRAKPKRGPPRLENQSTACERNVEVDGDLESATDIGPGSKTEAKHEGVQDAKDSEVLRLQTQLELLEQKLTVTEEEKQCVVLKLTATEEEKQCVVCMNEIARVIFVPCRHMKCCVRCVLKIEQSTTHDRIRCPMCMADVQDWMEAFT